MKIMHVKKHFFPGFFAFTLLIGLSLTWVNLDNSSSAADARKFNAGNIMSDFVMTNKSSMTEAQIQTFLLSKNSCNDRNISKAAAYPHLQYNIRDGKFVCLAEESFNGESAARIIWQAAQDYNINPQVLIVLLEKEQGLITDTWPNNIQYRAATGYGCPDTADCDGKYYGFKNQVRNAANFFRAYQTGNTGWYKLVWPGSKYTGAWQPFDYAVQLHPNTACGSISTRIENRATASLYSYTPYRPNQAALNAQYGHGDNCSSYGNRNFWMFFSDWFGSTQGLIYNGIDYSQVFDPVYYSNNNPDIKAAYGGDLTATFYHFIFNGIYEGRQGNSVFSINSYKTRYEDLRAAYGSDLHSYVWHYISNGKREGRVAVGDYRGGTTKYNGIDYSSVYSFDYYTKAYPDIWSAYGLDDQKALRHFIFNGIYEGRQGNSVFSINSYKTRYEDLRAAYGSDLHSYVWHYISNGKREGRVAVD